ncbi:SLAP domain-containing protein [Lactobacillus ultunensis]|uniref:SLAP domain-containing protein n=1 Tax=Lactobacillus ultunensis TaxID=227945 RepID=UPI001F3F180E|nr:SLAP domain-containing protein [Lactobacillus ultunensis]
MKKSYVYTKNGKLAKKNGKRVVLKKSTTRKVLNNAKVVKIHGKAFYQIGKNQFVKAVNVITSSQKVNVRVVVKGRKNAKVRTYTSTGKRTRHFVYGKKSYKFTAKRGIKGKTTTSYQVRIGGF